MGKKAEKLSNSSQMEKVEALAKDWYNANLDKNEGARRERKAAQDLETELADHGEIVTVPITDRIVIDIGIVDAEREEIDPRKFMEMYPDLFWDYVSISKTQVSKALGDVVAAKAARVVKTQEFKVKKRTLR